MRTRALRKKHTPVDKSVLAVGTDTAWRDRGYMDWLRTQPCMVTGFRQTEYSDEAVDPCHIRSGTFGKLKPHDFYTHPVCHSHHLQHDREAHYWLTQANEHPHILMEAIKAQAVVRYLKWKLGVETDRELVAAITEARHD